MFMGCKGKIQKTIEEKKCVCYEILYFGMEGFVLHFILEWKKKKFGHQPSKPKKYARDPSLGTLSHTDLLYPSVWLAC